MLDTKLSGWTATSSPTTRSRNATKQQPWEKRRRRCCGATARPAFVSARASGRGRRGIRIARKGRIRLTIVFGSELRRGARSQWRRLRTRLVQKSIARNARRWRAVMWLSPTYRSSRPRRRAQWPRPGRLARRRTFRRGSVNRGRDSVRRSQRRPAKNATRARMAITNSTGWMITPPAIAMMRSTTPRIRSMRSRYPAKGLHNLEAALESQREVLRPDGDEVDAWLSQSRSLARARAAMRVIAFLTLCAPVRRPDWRRSAHPARSPGGDLAAGPDSATSALSLARSMDSPRGTTLTCVVVALEIATNIFLVVNARKS